MLRLPFLLLILKSAALRGADGAVEVVAPAWVKALGLHASCSFTSQFWGTTVTTIFQNVTALVSPGGNVICNTDKPLLGYFLIEQDFNYLTNKENVLELPCFDKEHGSLMNLLQAKPTLLLHNHSKYMSYFPRGHGWLDDLYQSRTALRGDVNSWIASAVVDCDWDPGLLEIIQNTSKYAAADPVVLDVEIDVPPLLHLIRSFVYRFFFQFFFGGLYMVLALVAFLRAYRATQHEKRRRKRNHLAKKILCNISNMKPMHVVLVLQSVYCCIEGLVHLIDGWQSTTTMSTRTRAMFYSKETGLFLGISFLMTLVWKDLLAKLGGKHALQSQSFMKRNQTRLIVAGTTLISIDIVFFALIASEFVHIALARVAFSVVYLLAAGFISVFFTWQVILFWRTGVWRTAQFGQGADLGSQVSAIAVSLKRRAKLLLVSACLKFVMNVLICMLVTPLMHTPAGWLTLWFTIDSVRALDCWLQIEISSKLISPKKSTVAPSQTTDVPSATPQTNNKNLK